MRRYPCNKGELTLIHIRISGTRAQISRRYQKTMRNGRHKIIGTKYMLYFRVINKIKLNIIQKESKHNMVYDRGCENEKIWCQCFKHLQYQ